MSNGRPATDRHAADIEAIRRDVVTAPEAVTDRALRERVLAGDYPDELRSFLLKVRDASYRIADDDIAALRHAGVSEDEIYELTVAAAVGIAFRRYESATRAVRTSA